MHITIQKLYNTENIVIHTQYQQNTTFMGINKSIN